MCPKHEKVRYFQKQHFHSQKPTPWLGKHVCIKKNMKAIFHCNLVPTSLIITTFASGEFFRPTGYILDYESVVFENTLLFHVWGTFIDPSLCWKSIFGLQIWPLKKKFGL